MSEGACAAFVLFCINDILGMTVMHCALPCATVDTVCIFIRVQQVKRRLDCHDGSWLGKYMLLAPSMIYMSVCASLRPGVESWMLYVYTPCESVTEHPGIRRIKSTACLTSHTTCLGHLLSDISHLSRQA